MNIVRLVEEKYKANSFIVIAGSKCIVIDVNYKTLSFIQDNNLTPVYTFLTHEHFDHIRGLSQLKECYKEMLIIASRETSRLIVTSKGNLSFYIKEKGFSECSADLFLEENPKLSFASYDIHLYSVPGHTAGGMAISIGNMLFTGDTLMNIKTPTTMPNSSKRQLKNSLIFLKNIIGDNTIIYQGHGEAFLKKDWNINISLGIKQ